MLHIPVVQTWLAKKVAANLSEKLHAKVTVKKVDFRFFSKILVEGVMVEDQKKDTLLYAGLVKADLNDWFFLKDKITVSNIELDNAVVNMNRKDSVWNYQFIEDYFSAPKKPGAKSKDQDFDLKELHFKNIFFNKKDGWVGQDMIANLSRLDVLMYEVDLQNKKIHIKSIYAERPYFSQSDYDGAEPEHPGLQKILQKIPVVSAFKWNNSGWEVRLDKMEMKDGAFQMDKQTVSPPYTDRFDGKHLFFSAINGTMNNLVFIHDTLRVTVELNAKEKSGLLIKKLFSNMKLTPELMEFNDLDLITGCSHLRDYYAMKYRDFNEDFSSFMHNVELSAHFTGSTVCSDDLAIFSPDLKSWNRVFNLEGDAKGMLDNFSAKNMKIRSGNTYLEGNIAMRGLPDITTTFIDFQSKKLLTNYADMVSIVPQLRSVQKPAISKLGTVSFNGNFSGFIRDFVAYGTFNTALGSLTADVNMKTPENAPAAYSGNITTAGFKIGSFFNAPQLGNIAMNIKLSGVGFNIKDLKAKVDGTVSALQLGSYQYHNIIINGDFEKKLFIGHLSIDDPNLKIPSLDGALNLSDKDLGFKLLAGVQKANLHELGFSKDNLSFTGDLDLNFTGNNIDNFLGTAAISNAVLRRDTTRFSFDSLFVKTEMVNGKKSLTLSSNDIHANVTGNFKIMELPDAVRVLLARYYPAYITAPSYIVKSAQDFNFSVQTNNLDQYLSLFDKKLHGFNNADISGSFNLQNYALNLKGTVPQFSYDGKIFNSSKFDATGTKDSLVTNLAVADIIINDSMHLPDTRLKISASNDVSLIKLNTSASRIFGDAELNASVQTLTDGVKIHFYPSSFIINNKKWQLDKDGELTVRRHFLNASEVKFFHDDQAIVLSTELSTEDNSTQVVAKLKDIDLGDLAFILPKKPALAGQVSGTATARNIFGKTTVDFKGTADSFALDGTYMGRINLDADANIETGIIKYHANTDEKNFKFDLSGVYNSGDTTGNSLQTTLNATRIDLSVIQPYLNTIFTYMHGMANGKLQLVSKNNSISLLGDAIIDSGSFKVAYTQVRYDFDKQPVHFGKDLIDIGTMQVHDTLGNTGVVSGKIFHHFFQDFSFEDLNFSSPKIVLLNTTKKDNADFYGRVTGRASMTLNGDIANMKMNIDGEPSATDSSHIYLPTGASKESNDIDYIDFIQFGSLMDNDHTLKNEANLTVDMNLTANPACNVDVILDEETGDIIKGRGNGRLNIRVGSKEPLTIRGQYFLTQGAYTFDFETFLKRPFTLTSGSITWNGDPYLADLDMKAEFLAKNVDISSITTSGRGQTDITVLSHITGSLKKPIVNFEFVLPQNSPYDRDFYVVKRLADFKNDENEMNKQVASLLLFSQLISNNQAFLTGGTVGSLATSTIGGVISSWLTNVLSKALEKATKGKVSPYIELNPSLNLQQANQLEANIRAGVKVRLRANLQLLVGGNLDYNNPLTQLYSKGVITPDISLEWLLNKDGSLRVVAFNRTTIDFTTGQRNRSGLQFTYQKDVNRLGDIFRSKKKIEQLDSLKYTPKKPQ